MKLLFTVLSLMTVALLGAAESVINVADHGIVPGKDVSFQVNELIESLRGQKGVTLHFPKGRYEFYPEKAVEKYRAVTNHDNGMKRMAFPLFGLEGFTLDGGGSTFMFHGRISPFILDGSKGVTLKNFSIDWDTPFHHELKVVERDENQNSFVAEISPMKYGFEIKDGQILFNHYDWQDTIGQNVAFDPKTAAPIWNSKAYALTSKKSTATKVSANRVKFENTTRVAPPVGTVIANYGPSPNRLAQAIHVANSLNTTIKNVTVYAAGGMALIAERCENILLDGFVVTSTSDRVLSTRADATHFLGCKGLITLENCRLEHMGDDGINVHGAYVNIEKQLGEKTFLCAISHRQQLGLTFTEPGDRVMFTSRKTVLPLFPATVKHVKVLDEEFMEITVSDVPAVMPTGPLSLENLTWNPDVVMKHNVIRDNRARSALISTKGKVLIEDNVFSSQMHGILIEGDNKSWYESGGVRDVTINRNTFENIGYGSGEGYPLFAAPMLNDDQYFGDDQYHRNISFTNNRIMSFNGLLVHAESVKGLTVTGNVIELSNVYPSGSVLPAINLDYCQDVVIEENQFKGFNWVIGVEAAENCTKVRLKNNEGLIESTKSSGLESAARK